MKRKAGVHVQFTQSGFRTATAHDAFGKIGGSQEHADGDHDFHDAGVGTTPL